MKNNASFLKELLEESFDYQNRISFSEKAKALMIKEYSEEQWTEFFKYFESIWFSHLGDCIMDIDIEDAIESSMPKGTKCI